MLVRKVTERYARDLEYGAIEEVKKIKSIYPKESIKNILEEYLEFYFLPEHNMELDICKSTYDYHALVDFKNNKLYFDSDTWENEEKKYFLNSTIAHEMGHIKYHRNDIMNSKKYKYIIEKNDFNALYRESTDIKNTENAEWQAFRFGAALLMPIDSVLCIKEKGGDENDLAIEFGVSKKMALYRFNTVEYLLQKK